MTTKLTLSLDRFVVLPFISNTTYDGCRISQAAKRFRASLKECPISTLLKLGCVAATVYLLVDKYTLVHPYLLADNRSGF